MVQWRSVFITLGFIMLCLFIIPIKINNVEIVEKRVLFESFIKSYNKTYNASSEEYETRFKIFQESLEHIKLLNADKNDSIPTALYGITNFSDISTKEFDDEYLVYEYKKNSHDRRHFTMKYHPNHLKRSIDDKLPRSVDWRKNGCVTEVKNQKTCGACWAFSTIGTVESMVAIKTGKLISFSTQEIIDCAQNGNMGCDGGDTCTLLQWLVDNNIGIKEEKEYPLVLQTETCKLKQSDKGVHVASNYTCDYFWVREMSQISTNYTKTSGLRFADSILRPAVGDEEKLLNMLAYHGPVAVAVNALTWQFYVGGIIQFHCDGSLENLNHAVELVGYNLDSTPPYYIARNSWGKSYGEKGYLRIAVGSNVCGIASEVASLDVL